MGKRKESEVGEVVLNYLHDLRQDTYCEVVTDIGRIDIVSVGSNSLITAIEIKTTLSFDLLAQAIHRSGYCHRSVAACPFPKLHSHKRTILKAIHAQYGIGIWRVERNHVTEEYPPRIQRHALANYVKNSLRPEQKNQPAGVNMGYWSPFQQTKKDLIAFVRDNPGCSIKEAIAGISHHYKSSSTAYSSIAKWIRTNVIKEVVLTGNGLQLVD